MSRHEGIEINVGGRDFTWELDHWAIREFERLEGRKVGELIADVFPDGPPVVLQADGESDEDFLARRGGTVQALVMKGLLGSVSVTSLTTLLYVGTLRHHEEEEGFPDLKAFCRLLKPGEDVEVWKAVAPAFMDALPRYQDLFFHLVGQGEEGGGPGNA